MTGAGTASSLVFGGSKIDQPGTRPSPPRPFARHDLALGAGCTWFGIPGLIIINDSSPGRCDLPLVTPPDIW